MLKLKQSFNGQLQENTSLKSFTTLNIGGPAKALLITKTETELIQAIKMAQEENISYLVIGGGSNLLIADEGVDLLIIKNAITGLSSQDLVLRAWSGTPLQKLVNFTVQKGLAGLQKLTGIPGTVGGAVYGNAGAYGQTISDHLTEIKCFNGQEIVTLSKKECGFDYRHSNFKNTQWIILEASFKLSSQNSKTLKEEEQQILNDRLSKYPLGLKCPGSFFKNVLVSNLPTKIVKQIPQDKILYGKIPAGYLLESVGAKGQSQGGVEVSSHANIFINQGEGMASDFYQLAKNLAQKVKEKYGISLEPEVQLIGLPPIN